MHTVVTLPGKPVPSAARGCDHRQRVRTVSTRTTAACNEPHAYHVCGHDYNHSNNDHNHSYDDDIHSYDDYNHYYDDYCDDDDNDNDGNCDHHYYYHGYHGHHGHHPRRPDCINRGATMSKRLRRSTTRDA